MGARQTGRVSTFLYLFRSGTPITAFPLPSPIKFNPTGTKLIINLPPSQIQIKLVTFNFTVVTLTVLLVTFDRIFIHTVRFSWRLLHHKLSSQYTSHSPAVATSFLPSAFCMMGRGRRVCGDVPAVPKIKLLSNCELIIFFSPDKFSPGRIKFDR